MLYLLCFLAAILAFYLLPLLFTQGGHEKEEVTEFSATYTGPDRRSRVRDEPLFG